MKVVASDPKHDNFPKHLKPSSLDKLLTTSDVIVLLASHTKGQQAIIGSKELKRMKKDTLLVNPARGELVDESAICLALNSNILGGYATDVLANETLIKNFTDHPLIRLSREKRNVIVTPHIGGATNFAMSKTEAFVVQKLLAQISS